MYLVLGNKLDPCCQIVSAALRQRALMVRVLDCPFTGGATLSWSLASKSESRLVLDDGHEVTSDKLDGVVVGSRGWIQGNDWQPEDHDYMRSETQAALLGWLWSLSCPVVGRLPASVWYRPLMPVTYWQPLLARCGLAVPEALVTNVVPESRGFRDRFGGGAVYAPFSTPARYLIASESDWTGLAAVQDRAPVCLEQPHGSAQPVCVAGDRVIWDAAPPAGSTDVESRLRRFAASAGLNFVEFSIACGDCLRVVDVNAQPRLARFSRDARVAIGDAIVECLTGDDRWNAAARA